MKYLAIFFISIIPCLLSAQYCDSFGLTLEDDLELDCDNNTLTALHDQMDRDYVYTANAEGGLTVLSSIDPENLEIIASLESASFDDLTVNRVIQRNNLLFLPLGSMFGAHDQPSGLAIVSVENPLFPEVLDVWASEENAGAAHVGLAGDVAYLCGLSNGVIALSIVDPTNISFISQYIPPTDWPVGTDVEKIKARNIVIDGTTAYLAYDAGGMRILQLGDAAAIEEIGRYSNPALDGAARAYNNIIKRDDLLYVAVDYAGMEVLDVSDPTDVTLHGWWNPNEFPLASPALTSLRWFSSPWHTNEIDMIDECSTIFMSCGRTEIVGIDVSDPSVPILCGSYGDSTDSISSYGMTVYKDRIYVGHICSPIPIPFPAAWSGVKSLIYDSACPLGIDDLDLTNSINIYPNPAESTITITEQIDINIHQISIIDLTGKLIQVEMSNFNSIDISTLSPGIYIIRINADGRFYDKKIMVE
jgi:hypothetical protein